MSSPKKHHFVPCAYLDRFSEPDTDFLHVYSKRAGMWRRQIAKKIMVRNGYYKQRWVPDGVDENILEKSLGAYLEPRGLGSLRLLVDAPNKLTVDDVFNIINYIEFQRIRVPRQAEAAKVLAKSYLEHLMMSDKNDRRLLEGNYVEIKDAFRFEFMRMASGQIGPYLSRMVWEVVEAQEGSFFITSDSPVVLVNEGVVPPGEPGIALYGSIVLFSLDSKHLLILKHPEYISGEKGAMERLPQWLDYEDNIKIISGGVIGSDAVNYFCSVFYQSSLDEVAGCSKRCIDIAVGRTTTGR